MFASDDLFARNEDMFLLPLRPRSQSRVELRHIFAKAWYKWSVSLITCYRFPACRMDLRPQDMTGQFLLKKMFFQSTAADTAFGFDFGTNCMGKRCENFWENVNCTYQLIRSSEYINYTLVRCCWFTGEVLMIPNGDKNVVTSNNS